MLLLTAPQFQDNKFLISSERCEDIFKASSVVGNVFRFVTLTFADRILKRGLGLVSTNYCHI